MASPPAVASPTADAKPEATRLIVADTQSIFRLGVRRICAVEDDLRVAGQAENMSQLLAAVAKFPADVVLLDSRVSPTPYEAVADVLQHAPHLKVVVLVGSITEEDTVEYLRRGARGILTRSVPPDLLVKCVRCVAAGETWLDHRSVNWVIEAYRAQSTLLTQPRPRNRLSEKELLIISCITRGMKNKEIAEEVGTTEQVVKNYLRKVYDKLGVSDRLELALYCVHHRLLEGIRPSAQATAAAGAASSKS
jgi:DNA-binding NarL/FixJ family response regulator